MSERRWDIARWVFQWVAMAPVAWWMLEVLKALRAIAEGLQ